MIKMTASPRELIWIAPFLCIALMALALLRPLPHFPVPARSRTVMDGGGTPVRIALPFRGTALTWGVNVAEYLEDTHAPETLLKAGGPFFDRPWFARQVASWIYPQVLEQDSIWDASGVSRGRGANAEIETHFAFDPGAYLGVTWGPVPLMRRVGLPALYVAANTKNWDEWNFSTARVVTALIGHPERGEALIARYCQAYVDLDRELHTSTLASRPRVLIMGSSHATEAGYT